MVNKVNPFWILVVALAALLWLPNLFALGMFMDGVYDALTAMQLAKGISTFWAPQTVYYAEPASWGNTPLSIGILALCYKIFGNHYVVERGYSFVTAIIQLLLIQLLWRTVLYGQPEEKKYAWFPCLLFMCSPLTGWCYSNNLMENTMSIFTTASIIVMLQYIQGRSNLIVAGVFTAFLLLLAFITKGPVSVFPFTVPVLFLAVNEKFDFKKAMLLTVIVVASFTLLFALLFSFQEPQVFLKNYMEVQVMPALKHEIPGSYVPYQIFIELLIALSPFIGVALILFFAGNKIESFSFKANFWWRFLLLGLCGSLPIALSVKQSKFYLLPSLIPYVIGFSILFLPAIKLLAEKVTNKFSWLIHAVSTVAIIAAAFVSVFNIGGISRDVDLLNDLRAINSITANEKVVGGDWELYDDWQLRGYFLRLYGQKIAMLNEHAEVNYELTKRGKTNTAYGFAQVVFSGKKYELRKR